MDQVDAQGLSGGHQQGGHQNHGGAAVEEEADDQQKDVAHQQEQPGLGDVGGDELGDHLGQPLPGQVQGESLGGRQNEHDAGGGVQGFLDDGGHVRPLELLVDELAHQDGVDDAHGAGLGGGEPAQAQAHDQAEGDEQGPDAVFQRPDDLGLVGLVGAGGLIVPLLGDEGRQDHQRDHHEDARQIARVEHFGHGHVGAGGVQNQDDARGDDGGDAGRRRGDDAGPGLAVAQLGHLGHQHLGLHGGVGQVGAGEAAHQGGEQDVHLGQAAGPPAGDQGAEVHDSSGDAGVVHQHAGGGEEGDGQKRRALQAGADPLGVNLDRSAGLEGEIEGAGAENRDKDRDLQEQHHQHDNRRDGDKIKMHLFPPPLPLCCFRASKRGAVP